MTNTNLLKPNSLLKTQRLLYQAKYTITRLYNRVFCTRNKLRQCVCLSGSSVRRTSLFLSLYGRQKTGNPLHLDLYLPSSGDKSRKKEKDSWWPYSCLSSAFMKSGYKATLGFTILLRSFFYPQLICVTYTQGS